MWILNTLFNAFTMEDFFWWCVDVMDLSAAWLGLTYEEWNVILFVIIHPVITLVFMATTIYFYRRSKRIVGKEHDM